MPTPPGWLKQFADTVCASLHALSEEPLIGCHFFRKQDGGWEISLFFSPVEIVGGEYDGERLSCLFVVDVLEITHLFQFVESVTWQPHPMDTHDELGSHLSVLGYVHGQSVELRVLSDMPEQMRAGQSVNVLEKSFNDHWTA